MGWPIAPKLVGIVAVGCTLPVTPPPEEKVEIGTCVWAKAPNEPSSSKSKTTCLILLVDYFLFGPDTSDFDEPVSLPAISFFSSSTCADKSLY